MCVGPQRVYGYVVEQITELYHNSSIFSLRKNQIWSLVGKYGINKAIIDSFLLQYQFELKCSCLILLSLRFDIYGNDCQEVRFFWTRDKYWILSCFLCNPEIDQYCLTIACNVPILSHILVYLVLVYQYCFIFDRPALVVQV